MSVLPKRDIMMLEATILERGFYIAKLHDAIDELNCCGEWCGKSPSKDNNYDGRCPVCKLQEIRNGKNGC